MTAVDVKIVVRDTGVELYRHDAVSQSSVGRAETVIARRCPHKKIVNAAALFDIRVLDHIIIGRNEYFSFHDEGVM